LWKFNPTAGTWTWVSGSNTVTAGGIYGTQGVASTGNAPGAREAAVSWTDSSGNLWLFGGYGYASPSDNGNLNDLWEFNPTAGTWTWVSGSNTSMASGVYGTQGVPSTGNVPGARTGAVTWSDSSGNLWLFGGNGAGSVLNDLWEFNPTAGTWTWVGGSNTANSVGNYGTQGVASTSNMPGARSGAISWTDSFGNLWLFGGFGFDPSDSGDLNDLWEFNPTAGTWEWVSGSNSADDNGVYGTLGIASTSNVPAARTLGGSSWTDSSGNLWLFGGIGTSARLNDLWKFNPTTGSWTWVGGSNAGNASGVYGTLGVASTSNVPGARQTPLSWTDSSGNLWLFGGLGNDSTGSSGVLNDLWKYTP